MTILRFSNTNQHPYGRDMHPNQLISPWRCSICPQCTLNQQWSTTMQNASVKDHGVLQWSSLLPFNSGCNTKIVVLWRGIKFNDQATNPLSCLYSIYLLTICPSHIYLSSPTSPFAGAWTGCFSFHRRSQQMQMIHYLLDCSLPALYPLHLCLFLACTPQCWEFSFAARRLFEGNGSAVICQLLNNFIQVVQRRIWWGEIRGLGWWWFLVADII